MSEPVARLLLPPPFRAIKAGPGDLLDLGRAHAAEGAGTLLWRESPEGVLAFAVILEPGPPLVDTPLEAELGHVACMAALCDALAHHGQPERQLRAIWPDRIEYDAALIAGCRWLAGPPAQDGLPAWVIFSAEIIAARPGLEDAGTHPGTTSLEEEEFPASAHLIESFAAFLKLIVDRWHQEGRGAVLRRLLDRVEGDDALKGARIENGTLQLPPLAEVLDEAAWRDPVRGGPAW